MKTTKSRIYREPGCIRWSATPQSGEGVDIYVQYSADGVQWTSTGPYRDPNGERFPFSGVGKIKLSIKLRSSGSFSRESQLAVHKVTIHRFDEVIEFGGESGW